MLLVVIFVILKSTLQAVCLFSAVVSCEYLWKRAELWNNSIWFSSGWKAEHFSCVHTPYCEFTYVASSFPALLTVCTWNILKCRAQEDEI